MSKIPNMIINEPVFTGSLLIQIYGDADLGAAYVGNARALLGACRTQFGINERIASGELGGFYTLSSIESDGTRIVVISNNGFDQANIFLPDVPPVESKEEQLIYTVDNIKPCARAGVRYYDSGTATTAAFPGVSYSYTYPIQNPEPPYDALLEPNVGAQPTAANPCFYHNPLAGPYTGFFFSCHFGSIDIDVPAIPPQKSAPPATLQFVGGGRFGYTHALQGSTYQLTVIKTDADFTLDSTLTFPPSSVPGLGWWDVYGTNNTPGYIPVRVFNYQTNELTILPPLFFSPSDIEYEPSPSTYSDTPVPAQFRFDPNFGDTENPIDYSGDQALLYADIPGTPVCISGGSQWYIDGDTNTLGEVPGLDAQGNQPGNITWTFPAETVEPTVCLIAHDRACDCIVGLGLLSDSSAFFFFVVDPALSPALEILAVLDINVADFEPVNVPSLNATMPYTFMASEGVAVVTFQSDIVEANTGALRIPVIDYCSPTDDGETTQDEVTETYQDGKLTQVNRRSVESPGLPIRKSSPS